MYFWAIMDGILSFAQSHIFVVIVFGLGSLFILYRRPKLFFSILFLVLFLGGLFYTITTVGGLGAEHKKGLIYQEEEQSESNP
jgi:ABC-type microcin C transport system permease subunit YejB